MTNLLITIVSFSLLFISTIIVIIILILFFLKAPKYNLHPIIFAIISITIGTTWLIFNIIISAILSYVLLT